MSDSHLIHETLYFALIEMRNRGLENNDKVVFGLCDLFHNIVMQMGDAAEGNRTYAEVLQNLKNIADDKDCRGWLDNIWSQLQEETFTEE